MISRTMHQGGPESVAVVGAVTIFTLIAMARRGRSAIVWAPFTSAAQRASLVAAQRRAANGDRSLNSFTGATVDDLMKESIEAVLDSGTVIAPSKGACRELHPVALTLTNPLARLSRTESRGRLFSALGETCWYLSRASDPDFIGWYLGYYRTSDPQATAWGGYGARLFGADGFDQVRYVIDRLRSSPDSRQAVIQIFDHDDVATPRGDVPCTCTLQYLLRSGELHSIAYLRSNDVHRGLPHDLFAFTMLQELIARSVGVEVGTHTHLVGSFHLYDVDAPAARDFLAEGWQSSNPMPPMPAGDPWPAVGHLLEVEEALRVGGVDPLHADYTGDRYWADLERLLGIFSLWKAGRNGEVALLRQQLHSPVYEVYIADKLVDT
jgi:thymidylate synthase